MHGIAAQVRRHAADAVTGARAFLAPAFAYAVIAGAEGGASPVPALLFGAIALSDLADGWLARRFGTASRRGRRLDHATDIWFVLVAFGAYVRLGAVPYWVPMAVGASFAAYMADFGSRRRRTANVLANRLGHYGGVLNYVVIGILVGDESSGLRVLPLFVRTSCNWAVLLASATAMATRLLEPVLCSACVTMRRER